MVGFIIATVVLAAALIGGIYWVRHSALFQGETIAVTKPTTDTKNDATDDKKAAQKSDEQAKKDDEAKKQQEAADRQKAEEKAKADAQKQKEQEDAQKAVQAQNQPSAAPDANATPSDNLPKTGPTDTAVTLFAVAVLTIATSFYISSRKDARV